VHLKDKAELPIKHPLVAREFAADNFTVQWTKRAFSSIQIDQNMSRTTPALVEMMELLVSLKTPMPCSVGWFQVLKFKEPSKKFQHKQQRVKQGDTRHYDQTSTVQAKFAKDVRSLLSVMEEFGIHF